MFEPMAVTPQVMPHQTGDIDEPLTYVGTGTLKHNTAHEQGLEQSVPD